MDNVDDFLAHYGKKGMKWGVVNDDDGGGSSGRSSKKSSDSSKKSTGDAYAQAMDSFYKKKDPKQIEAEARRKLKAQADKEFPHSSSVIVKSKGSKKSDADDADIDDPTLSDVKEGRLSRKQKIALGVGAAVAVGALAYYGNQKLGNNNQMSPADIAAKFGKDSQSAKNFDGKQTASQKSKKYTQNHADRDAELNGIFGDDPNAGTHPNKASSVFYPGLTNKKALDRPGFTLPQSTVFQRLSNHPETGEGYSKGTYSTFLKNDNRFYGSSGEFGGKKYTLNYQPKAPVKVPSTRTVLDSIKAMGDDTGKPYSDEQAFTLYESMAGGGWDTSKSKKLISSLKNQGYSAIVDDMDAGVLGDLPVVFFGEPTNITATPRTSKEIADDRKNVVPPSRRYA